MPNTAKQESQVIEFFMTNYNQNIFNEKMKVDLIYLGNNNYENLNGTMFHIFNGVPYLRNIPSNKEWFGKNIYHFNELNIDNLRD